MKYVLACLLINCQVKNLILSFKVQHFYTTIPGKCHFIVNLIRCDSISRFGYVSQSVSKGRVQKIKKSLEFSKL